jgi:hypothetical protein
MEKKARVKRLNHQDDVKRSWAAAYSITDEFEESSLNVEPPTSEEQEPTPQNQPPDAPPPKAF